MHSPITAGVAATFPKEATVASPHASSEYIPSLDGMRAVAILLVVLSHLGLEHIVPGRLGVTLFFFISGFLITRLLIAEASKARAISIGAFYARRFLRLAPALLLMLAVVALAWTQFVGPVNGPQLLAGIFYMMNYFIIFGGLTTMPIGILWSLAVEEHYYL